MRAWEGGDEWQLSLNPIYEDVAMWGLLICDIIGHVVNAYGGTDEALRAYVKERVLQGFLAEFQSPTDAPKDITPSTET